MRPRVFPAETAAVTAIRPARLEASMRPRVFPRGRRALLGAHKLADTASMRPRVFPAEDLDRRAHAGGSVTELQ